MCALILPNFIELYIRSNGFLLYIFHSFDLYASNKKSIKRKHKVSLIVKNRNQNSERSIYITVNEVILYAIKQRHHKQYTIVNVIENYTSNVPIVFGHI